MGERGADNAPGPARCRRHSLAGPAGGRGVGVAEGGQGKRGGDADKECASCARPHRSGSERTRVCVEARPWGGAREPAPCAAAGEPPGVRDACQLGGAWAELASDWAGEPGA